MEGLQAPFPYFGGKSRVALEVWRRFGDPKNYIEPFCGSCAVLLARPSEPKIETVNDMDGLLTNFWRAVRAEPDAVADLMNWPVNEIDLEARHKWLCAQPAKDEFQIWAPGRASTGNSRTSATRAVASTGNSRTSATRAVASTGNYRALVSYPHVAGNLRPWTLRRPKREPSSTTKQQRGVL